MKDSPWVVAVSGILCMVGLACAVADDVPSRAPESESGQRYLIIHADDAGMSHSANLGTIHGMEKGVVSSASIMVPCPWFPEFADYARQHPKMDFGVHLTLNCEWDFYRWGPVAPREKVPSLVDKDGYLWDNVAQVAAHVSAREVDVELRAQIDRAKDFGVPLSHIDTHMGAVLSRPDLVEIYVSLGIDYDLPVLFLRKMGEEVSREYPALAEKGSALVRRLDEARLPILDSVAQHYGGKSHAERKANYLRTLRDLPPGVSQLIIHCGYDNEELRGITSSAARRDGDRLIFTDPEVIAEIQRQRIKVITWKQFRQMVAQSARK
ncbi:MAG: polysaccharide deacetylase family protein [Pirellulaceae bacterium]